MSQLGEKSDIIFCKHGSKLKVTSMNGMPFEIKNGTCELIRSKTSYFWKITRDTNESPQSKKIPFKNNLAKIKTRQLAFTINWSDKILSGELHTEKDLDCLKRIIDSVRNSNNSVWLCSMPNVATSRRNENIEDLHQNVAKENLPKYNGVSLISSCTVGNSITSNQKKSSIDLQIAREPLSEKRSQRISFSADRMKVLSRRKQEAMTGRPLVNITGRKSLFPPQSHTSKKPLIDKGDDENGFFLASNINTKQFYSPNNQENNNAKQAYAGKTSTMSLLEQNSTPVQKKSIKNKLHGDNDIVGFSNLGNTCYMNAVLQSLLCIPNFFQDLNNKRNLAAVEHNSLYETLCNLGMLKHSCETISDQRYALQRVKDAVSTISNRFSGYSQHDAHEFLCHCLDELKENLFEKMKNVKLENGEVLFKEQNLDYVCPVKENFESTLVHTITCQNCHENVVHTETCHDFSLDIPEADENFDPKDFTTADLFKHFFDEEIIEDYKCEKCEVTSPISSRYFSNLPRVLILHIKRYDMYHMKRSDSIIVSKNILVDKLVNSNTLLPCKFEYRKLSSTKCNKTMNHEAEKRKSTEAHMDEPLSKTVRQSNILDFDKGLSPIKSEKDCELQKYERKSDEGYCKEDSFTKIGEKRRLSVTSSTPANNDKNIFLTDDTIEIDDSGAKSLNKVFDDHKMLECSPTSKEDEASQMQKAFQLSLSTAGKSESCTMNSTLNKSEEDDFQKALQQSLVGVDEESDLKKAMEESLQSFQENQSSHYLKALPNDILSNDNIFHDVMNKSDDENVIEQQHENVYKLVGVVNHHGENTGMGHYTSDNYDFKSKLWHSFNDSSVRDVREHEVCYGRRESAYLVFYIHNSCFESISKTQ